MKQYMDQDRMINANSAYVLRIIQKSGSISRRQISEQSGLSWGGMTKIVNRLLENGYILEEPDAAPPAAGRIPHLLKLNTETNFVVGLDINMTGLAAVVTDLTGTVRGRFSAPVRTDFLLKDTTDFLASILETYPSGTVVAAGVAMQGIVDAKAGISVHVPGIRAWEDVPLRQLLETKFGLQVYLEHDPDCLLYPNLTAGGDENILLLRIDQSVGAAVALSGNILKGKGLLEIAHSTVIPEGKPCACGARGCLEAYLSPCVEDGKAAPEAMAEMVLPLAVAIRNLTAVFCADTVILTGALMRHRSLFENALAARLQQLQCASKLKILENCDSAAAGAAMIATDRWIGEFKLI